MRLNYFNSKNKLISRGILLLIYFSKLSLISQPAICLNFSTFFGKIGQDEIRGLCEDKQHNIYVIGNTYNSDLPTTSGAFQPTLKGNYEAFIAKFDSCGYLVWCTYFGTSGFDSGEKISFSSDNNIVICGYTDGSDLPTTSACFQPTYKGGNDCFLAKFNLSGVPIWITYFGDAGGDFAYDIKTDSLNNIIIGGTTTSNSLYTNSSSFQQTFAGNTDAFIAKFSKNGALKFCTFYGGSNSEDIHALAMDKDCNIIGTGGSFSFNLNTSSGCFQSTTNGGMEIYVLKLDSLGQRVFSTYMGSSGADDAFGICADRQNNIYVSGHTNGGTFFTSTGAFQLINKGNNDGYCFKLSAFGNMIWSTLLGGNANDFVSRMTINKYNEIAILFTTESIDLPMMGTSNSTVLAGGTDAALIKLSSNGTPFWSTFVGGSTAEYAHDIIAVNETKIAFVGSTNSSNYPLSGYVYQNNFSGTEDGLITLYNTKTNGQININDYNSENCTLGIRIIDQNGSLKLIPDKCLPNSSFYLFNLIGQCLRSGQLNEDGMNLESLDQGIYFLKLDLVSGVQKEFRFVKY